MGIFAGIKNAIRNAMRALKSAGSFVGNAFTNVANDFWSDFNGLWDWAYERAEQVISLPRKAIFGDGSGLGGGVPAPQTPDYSADIRAAQHDLSSTISRRQAPAAVAPAAGEKDIGDLVHAYASARKSERLLIDLDQLPLRVSGWLTGLSEKQLRALSDHGAFACSMIADGTDPRDLGISGIPECDAPAPDAGQAVRDLLRSHLAPKNLDGPEEGLRHA